MANNQSSSHSYKYIKIIQPSSNSKVFYLYLNRPSHRNALSTDFFTEFPAALSALEQNPDVSVIVLLGSGDHFCSGVDQQILTSSFADISHLDRGRVGEKLRRYIKLLQEAINAIEKIRKPVIVGVHGGCIGGGVDVITACDIRFCTADAFFSVKEVDLAITADLGSLQRLPAIMGFGNAMELALTGRRLSGPEAKGIGLVSRVFESKKAMEAAIAALAEEIAAKSPLAVVGTKAVLLRSRDLTVEQGLDYVATWNSGVVLSDDLKEAISALRQKRKPSFAKL